MAIIPITPLTVSIIANCQARPLSQILQLLNPGIEIHEITITHLAKPEEAENKYQIYENSDFIFAQWVSNDYPIGFVRSQQLKSEFGPKVIVWPNAFFRGQCADLFYVTQPKIGRVVGPLGEYQNLIIFEAWQQSRSIVETVQRLIQADDWLSRMSIEAEKSLLELKMREAECDVGVFNEVYEKWRETRLFFTFNHPAKVLLETLARKLLKFVACEGYENPSIQNSREPLDRIIPALMPSVAAHLELELPTTTISKGCEVLFGDHVRIDKGIVFYEPESLVETTFRALDLQLKPDTPVRIS